MKIPKQKLIDKGQIGGFISTFINSMFIFSFITFVNTTVLIYQSILKYYISIELFIVILIIGTISWMTLFYTIIFPSMQQFGNRQWYIHNNPMQKDIEKIKKKLGINDND